jgi:hypothetical protein
LPRHKKNREEGLASSRQIKFPFSTTNYFVTLPDPVVVLL